MRILVLDVGGTHVKALVLSGPDAEGPIGDPDAEPASRHAPSEKAEAASGQFQAAGGSHADPTNGPTSIPTPARIDSGPTLTAADMVTGVTAATAGWSYDAVSIGYPGPVVDGRPAVEPHNLGSGWVGFDFAGAFGHPVRVINDAAMQALGGYRGGRMLFLGLGTGLGSALVISGHLQPLELAHLPYKRGRTFEEYVGEAARERDGTHRWRRNVIDVVSRLHVAMQVDTVLLGGGNARRLEKVLGKFPPFTRLGSNADALRGGVRLWVGPSDRAGVELAMGAEEAAAR
ncbi:MAG TPA: hypothetical protein VGD56_00895 [Gemmatirosa sp.]